MAGGIVQGIKAGVYPPPELGPGQIPVEATADRELRVTDFDELAAAEQNRMVLLAILNELVMLNDRMFPNMGFDSERIGLAYEQLYRDRR